MAIVCGTDFSEPAIRAGEVAAALAAKLGEPLVLAHAVDVAGLLGGESIFLGPPPLSPAAVTWREAAERKLGEEAERLMSMCPETSVHVGFGAPDEVLLEAARRHAASLVVAGTRGLRPALRFFLGSTTERLARAAEHPLLAIRGDASAIVGWAFEGRTLRILVGVDFEAGFEGAVRVADRLRRLGRCELHYVHAVPLTAPYGRVSPLTGIAPGDEEVERIAREEMDRVVSRSEHRPDGADVVHGKPDTELARMAEERRFDLVAVGTHGRRGVERLLLGSVAAGVLRRAPCSVLVAPAAEATRVEAPAPRPGPSAGVETPAEPATPTP